MTDEVTDIDQFLSPSTKASSSTWMDKYQHLFDLCPVGKSFKIDAVDVKIATLRPTVSKIGAKQNKKFKVINHDESFEVFRKE